MKKLKTTFMGVTGAAWVAVFTATASAAPAPRLNVVYIISDDLNTELGCYGSSIVKSPNIDRLATRSVRFEKAYCNYPLCNPSRTSFLSGRRPDTTQVVDNTTPPAKHLGNAPFLPEFFRSHGYRTLKVGKIFHPGNDAEDRRSWDVNVSDDGGEDSNPPEAEILRASGPRGYVLRVTDESTPDGKSARRAAKMLEECAGGDQPFFIAAGFHRPHTPYAAPESYFRLYNPDQLTPRYGPPEHVAKIPKIANSLRPAVRLLPTERPGDTLAAYYASVSFMDAQVGILIDTLDRLGLWRNTLVIFHSDHGYQLGEHGGMWHKNTLFDEGVRVPLLVAAPGRKPTVSSGLVELVDVYPTLAELCGLQTPGGLEGSSFVRLLAEPGRTWKSAVFTVAARWRSEDQRVLHVSNLGRTVFDGRWRYTAWPDGSAELYDHQVDPFEYVNLAADPQWRAQLSTLKLNLQGGWVAAVPK